MRDLIDEYNNITTITNKVVFAASIFDTIGGLSPAVTCAKLLLRCFLNYWDFTLPEELIAESQKLFGLMRLTPVYNISRCNLDNFSLGEIKSIEMHGLSDNSARTYAFCIYLKFILYDGSNLVKLLC